ncbi:MAG: hypothetical protein MJE68_09270 [Proteobacteria bacterium]|nr:hypothetical protein [Pseudomonadota bacterium]
MSHSQSGTGIGHHLSPQHAVLSTSAPQKRSWLSETTQLPYDSNRTPPQRRANYSRHEIPRDASYHSNIHSEASGGRYPAGENQRERGRNLRERERGEGEGEREEEREMVVSQYHFSSLVIEKSLKRILAKKLFVASTWQSTQRPPVNGFNRE